MARFDLHNPGEEVLAFFAEYHLATLTIVKEDGTPHVTAVGFTYEPESAIARVITWADAWKARHVGGRDVSPAAICSVDGGRWLTLSGTASITSDPERVAEGVRRYSERYRTPGERDDRVVVEVAVDKIVGRA